MRGRLLVNERLAGHTSWRVGGPADRLYIPHDRCDLVAFIRSLPADEPLWWLGLGSNVLVRDGGVRGTVVSTKNRLKALRLDGDGTVYAEAGVPCALVAKFCTERGLVGAEFLAGIPGTMGGALAMNAGAFGGETWQLVREVETVDRQGRVRTRPPQHYTVGYRKVTGCAGEWFLAARLGLAAGDGAASRRKIKELLDRRARTQPTNRPSCGSVFKNPPGDHAARLIEAAGLKGVAIGGAQVSEKHANFIINSGQATALDIERLIAHVQRRVAEQQGVHLQTEVCMVGEAGLPGASDGRRFGRVAVLMGGDSAEREISLKSGAAVYGALRGLGIDAQAVDIGGDCLAALTALKVDRAFNIVHGRGGEDGVLQALLQSLGIPYTGSGVLASALAMDKVRTKLCWQGCGLPTPPWLVLADSADLDVCVDTLGLPVIVKPALEGSSLGISKAGNRVELAEAFALAAQFDCEVYAEQWVEGAEYTVALLDGQALPVIRLETPHAFYDYQAKYVANTTRYHCPCGLAADEEQAMRALAVAAAKAIGVTGWARVDVFIDHRGRHQLIEVNTVPGMTDHSLVPMAARQAGIGFDELVLRILATSLA